MFHFESTCAFADTAFAQNDDLPAAAKRIRNDGPFFECRTHGSKGTSIGKKSRGGPGLAMGAGFKPRIHKSGLIWLDWFETDVDCKMRDGRRPTAMMYKKMQS